MKSKFLCAMAQYDQETERKLKEIQRVLLENGFVGRQTPNLPQHITLGTFNVSEEEIMIKKVKKVSQDFSAFEVNLNSIGLFGLDVLFLAPSVNQELLNLQQYFNDNYANGLSWTAHTTMLIDDNEKILKAIPLLANEFKGFTARVESISLYEFWPTRFILSERL